MGKFEHYLDQSEFMAWKDITELFLTAGNRRSRKVLLNICGAVVKNQSPK